MKKIILFIMLASSSLSLAGEVEFRSVGKAVDFLYGAREIAKENAVSKANRRCSDGAEKKSEWVMSTEAQFVWNFDCSYCGPELIKTGRYLIVASANFKCKELTSKKLSRRCLVKSPYCLANCCKWSQMNLR